MLVNDGRRWHNLRETWSPHGLAKIGTLGEMDCMTCTQYGDAGFGSPSTVPQPGWLAAATAIEMLQWFVYVGSLWKRTGDICKAWMSSHR